MSGAGVSASASTGGVAGAEMRIDLVDVRYEIDGRPVVRDVTTTLRAGQFVCLLGANGAGKSTLVRLLAGELNPARGRIEVRGADDGASGRLNDVTAFLPSDLADPPFLTVGEVVALARWNQGASGTDFVADALEMCDALRWRDRKFDELSGGEAERAWLAFALAQDRPFLILDESLHAIDFNAQQSAFELMSQVASDGRGILLVTHDLHMATATADRLWVMHDGCLVYDGPAAGQDVDDVARLMRGSG